MRVVLTSSMVLKQQGTYAGNNSLSDGDTDGATKGSNQHESSGTRGHVFQRHGGLQTDKGGLSESPGFSNHVHDGTLEMRTCLEQASNADRSHKWVQDSLGATARRMSTKVCCRTANTYIFEVSSSVIISPHPRVMTAQATHITGRHLPVREMIWPETMDIKAPEREKGSILRAFVSLLENRNDIKGLTARRRLWQKSRGLGSTPAGSTSQQRSRRHGRKR